MLTLAWPALLLALPLPWLCARLPPAPAPGGALHAPLLLALVAPAAAGRSPAVRAVAVVVWLLLIAAAARPQWLGEPLPQPASGRDVMLAVDISASMSANDMQLRGLPATRLQVVQALAKTFIERRAGDRIGLILFGSQAYLQTPLTFDKETAATLLADAQPRLAGQQTALGDAIGLAVKRLRATPPPVSAENARQVLILLTDGASNAGSLSTTEAAELAAELRIVIYSIGIAGDPASLASTNTRTDTGTDTALDDAALRALAERTGGRYFSARNSDELASIYRLLDAIEPHPGGPQTLRQVREVYPWPLALALGLSAALAFYLGATGSPRGSR